MKDTIKKSIEELAKAKGIDTSSLSDIELFQIVTGLTFATEEFLDSVEYPEWYIPGGNLRSEDPSKKVANPTNVSGHIGSTDPTDLEDFDVDKDGDIDADDLAQVYSTLDAEGDAVIVNSANALSEIETPLETDIIVSNSEAMSSLTTNTYYKSVTLVGGEISNDVNINATENIVIDGLNISGEQGNSNGKIIFSASEVEFKNIKVENGSTVYNAFEGSGKTNDPNYTGLQKLVAENLEFDNPSLTHNVVNVYTPANNAIITIKDSKFNLTVDNSNVLRLSNYLNSENVTINFENVEWTYENSLSATSWPYAGLVIYQPAGSDIALTGDTSKIATWKFNFKNCKYNGEKVTANNMGEHNQVFYAYNINKSGVVSDPALIEGITIKFS